MSAPARARWRWIAWGGFGTGATFALLAPIAARLAAPIPYVREPFEGALPYAFAMAGVVFALVTYMHARGALRDFDELVPLGDPADPRRSEARAALLDTFPIAAFTALAFGLLVETGLQQLNVQRWTRFAAGDWNAFDVLSAVMVAAYILIATQFYAFALSTTVRIGRAARDLTELRPFDSSVFQQLFRYGLRTFLFLVVLPAAFFGMQYVVQGGAGLTLVFWMSVNVVLAVVVVVVPTRSITSRIRDWRRAELERIERASGATARRSRPRRCAIRSRRSICWGCSPTGARSRTSAPRPSTAPRSRSSRCTR